MRPPRAPQTSSSPPAGPSRWRDHPALYAVGSCFVLRLHRKSCRPLLRPSLAQPGGAPTSGTRSTRSGVIPSALDWPPHAPRRPTVERFQPYSPRRLRRQSAQENAHAVIEIADGSAVFGTAIRRGGKLQRPKTGKFVKCPPARSGPNPGRQGAALYEGEGVRQLLHCHGQGLPQGLSRSPTNRK